MKEKYKELSKAQIQDKRNLVISESSQGSIALGQQIIVVEGKHKTGIFLKGAVFIDKDKLVGFRDALNEAIDELGL